MSGKVFQAEEANNRKGSPTTFVVEVFFRYLPVF